MYVQLDERQIKNARAFLERTEMKGKETEAMAEIFVALSNPLSEKDIKGSTNLKPEKNEHSRKTSK